MMFNHFLSLATVTNALKITKDLDEDFESQIRHFIQIANIEVNKSVFQYADVDGIIDTGTDLFVAVKSLALSYFLYLFNFNVNRQLETSTQYKEIYDQQLASMIEMLKADKRVRTTTSVISQDPKEVKTLLPSQQDMFILD